MADFTKYNWESMLNTSRPGWENVTALDAEFKPVRLEGPRQDIRDLGKAFQFEGGGQDYISKESLTSTRLQNLLNKDNPYIKGFQNEALKRANASGMLSSTLAQNAATDAAIKAALPIAQQEAEMMSRADLARQEADIKSHLAEQGYMANLGQMQQQAEYNAAAQLFESMDKKQQQEFAALMDEYLKNKQLGATGIWNAEEYKRQAELLERELQNKLQMQQADLANRLALQQMEIGSREKIAQLGFSHDEKIQRERYKLEQGLQNAKYSFERELAKMGYDAATQQTKMNMANNLTNMYLNQYANMMVNPNISDDVRQSMLEHLNGVYVTNLNSMLTTNYGSNPYNGGGYIPSYGDYSVDGGTYRPSPTYTPQQVRGADIISAGKSW